MGAIDISEAARMLESGRLAVARWDPRRFAGTLLGDGATVAIVTFIGVVVAFAMLDASAFSVDKPTGGLDGEVLLLACILGLSWAGVYVVERALRFAAPPPIASGVLGTLVLLSMLGLTLALHELGLDGVVGLFIAVVVALGAIWIVSPVAPRLSGPSWRKAAVRYAPPAALVAFAMAYIASGPIENAVFFSSALLGLIAAALLPRTLSGVDDDAANRNVALAHACAALGAFILIIIASPAWISASEDRLSLWFGAALAAAILRRAPYGWLGWMTGAVGVVIGARFLEAVVLTGPRYDGWPLSALFGLLGVAPFLIVRHREWLRRVAPPTLSNLRDDLTGGGALEVLTSRRRKIVLDALSLGAFMTLLLRSAPEEYNAAFYWSEWLEVVTVAGYLSVILALLVSLAMRPFRRRLRLGPVALSGALAGVATFVALELSGDRSFDQQQGLSYLFGALTPLVLLPFLRNRRIDPALWRAIASALIGLLILDRLFSVFLGDAGAAYTIGREIGEYGALLTALAGLAVWVRYRNDAWSIVLWPATAFGSAVMARLLIAAQLGLDAVSYGFGAGWRELIIAALFGGLCGAGAILAKRIWIERQPQARADAVRVRGALLIVYAIWPLLVFAFMGNAIIGFSVDTREQRAAAADAVRDLANNAAAAGALAQSTVADVRRQSEDLAALVRDIAADVERETGQVSKELEEIAGEVRDAAKAVAGDAVGQVTAAGEALADKTIGKLGDALSLPWPLSGISDAIGSALGGLVDTLIPDIDWEAMFADFRRNMEQSFRERFSGVTAKTQDIANRLDGLAKGRLADAQARIDEAVSSAREISNRTRALIGSSATLAGTLFDQLTLIAQRLLAMLLLLAGAGLAFLTWRAAYGLMLMGERIAAGWEMLMDKREPPIIEGRAIVVAETPQISFAYAGPVEAPMSTRLGGYAFDMPQALTAGAQWRTD